MKAIKRFCFPERNRIFLALTLVLLPMIFLIIKYSDAPLLLPENWFGFLLCDSNDDKTLYNIAISYFAAYIFYIVQVYIPTAGKEKRAWLLIHRPLSSLVRDLKELLYLVDHMIEFQGAGIAEIINTNWFYKKEHLDRYPQPMDDTPSHQMKEGKHVRKATASCKSISDLCKKFNEVAKRAQKLMDMHALASLDPHTYALLINMDPAKFCEETANTINVIQHMKPLRKALSDAHATIKLQRIQELLKDLPGFYIANDDNHYWVSGPNNIKIDIPNDAYDQLPLHTSLQISIEKVKGDISKLEQLHDLDGYIQFREMDGDEIKDHREYDQVLAQAAKKVF